ncbi:hypothetical protein ACZ81_17190 [Alteromonas macleodii]|uniref:glycosyltransferase family 32 protein n=1 Tax=Alteromonas macleodii TaxID=28108 RepID=UPI000776BD54|nr:glycosyltransferase [Alteromonas macleodii]AMN13162.1 hypothetical protein ACZ81_17190 [Alteromonas macleodii]MBL3811656.1 hypothetical protein [Alteromonas macleodii]MBL3885194.1 hypothetical protein [Alteromonas macleodii]
MKPNTIVQFWNTPDLPDDISKLVATWKEQNPSMEHKLFSYDSALQFIAEHYGSEIKNLFESAALPAMQSDIFRVAYCLKMGGFYIDCGTRCNAPIQPLLSDDLLFLVRKWHGGIWNGAIGCNAGHPALEWIWDRIIQNLKARNSNDVWKLTGPLSFNQMVESKQFEDIVNVVEQPATKQYFDIVNELEHKKKHWSKVQEKQSVFKGNSELNADVDENKQQLTTPDVNNVESVTENNVPSTPAEISSNVPSGQRISEVECQVEIAGGFERDDVSRLIVNVRNIVLSVGVVGSFPLIINKRGNRAEVEFYEPKPNRHFPLSQFIASGNNGVTDYMLVMPEQMGSNTFYKLSSNDQADLITILTQLHIVLLKQQYSVKDNASVGSISNWCSSIERLILTFTEEKTKETDSSVAKHESSIVVKNLALPENKEQEENVLLLCGNAVMDSKLQPQSFTIKLHADNKVSAVTSIELDNAELLPNKTQLLNAVASSLHKTNRNGKVLAYSLERWYYAVQKFSKED